MVLSKVETNNDIKRLYRFFYALDKSYVSSLKEYKEAIKNGEAYILKDNDKVVGGIMQTVNNNFINVVNYYIPDSKRHTRMYLEFLRIITEYRARNGNKKVLITSDDVSEYKRLVTQVDGNVYELHIPSSRYL